MYWLHCNGCYCQPEPGVVLRFYITNCSHIYCEKCVSTCTKECCRVCQSQCTTLELSGKIQKEVENLFEEPGTILQKAMKQVNQVIEFQRSHQRRWCRHLKEMARQQGQQLRDVKKLVAQYRTQEKEIMDLKKENSYLKCLLAKSDPGINRSKGGGCYSAGASPNQRIFGRNSQSVPMSQQLNVTHRSGVNHVSPQSSGGGVPSSSNNNTNVLYQPGRILMRTPPSGGRLGTTRSRLSYLTPGSVDTMSRSSVTPLSVPRPINLSQNE